MDAAGPAVAVAIVSRSSRALAVGLGAYVVATMAATELGDFPMPVLGAGAGPVLGRYAALALVVAPSTSARSSGRV